MEVLMESDLFASLLLLSVTTLNSVTAFFSWRSMRYSEGAAANIQKVELATNSMKDALVAATKEAAFGAGREEGRAEHAVKS